MLYHAPLTVEPHAQDGKWVIDDDQLKVFVSERWALGEQFGPVWALTHRLGEHQQPRASVPSLCSLGAAPPDAAGC